ncbi:MAG: bifunctional DNA-formamidopyrimidine glycosylase/DNA-(apurinic or apyrimidinic site) lyase, partial [Thalassobaculaceae bacterium]
MVMILHLGMSGRVLITKDLPKVKDAHDHLTFKTEDGFFIRYNDPRRFGFVDIVPLKNLAEYPSLAALGPEPLSNAFNASALRQKINNKQSSIKSVLLDQTTIAGLGNIYVCEALHRSGISPRRKAKNISESKIDSLVIAIRVVLQDAINAGGSTLKDHLQTSGEMGYFQHQFRVYSREGEECMKKSCSGMIKRIIQSGRSTFFCGKCQR